MLLGIDIGNSNIVLGVFDGAELRASWRVQTRILATTEEYEVLVAGLFGAARIDPSTIDGVALASVVPPLTAAFAELAQRMFHQPPLVVDAGVRTGVKIRYDSPRDVGADRVVNAAAVCSHYGAPACIIDFGTGTTFDAINADGEYLGGAIAPGLEISRRPGRAHPRLPNVELRRRRRGSAAIPCTHASGLCSAMSPLGRDVERFRAELGRACAS